MVAVSSSFTKTSPITVRGIGQILILSLIIFGCLTSSGRNDVVEDSLEHYPPTPVSLDKSEFRYYYRLIDDFFKKNLIDRNFNGSILIAKNGFIVYEKYIGYGDLRKKDSLTDSTSFHIASTGKTFTAMAILRMADSSKLSLADTITKFFPGFPYEGITVQMLLNHRSGLPNYMYFMSDEKKWDKKQFVTNQDVLNFLYNEQPKKSFKAGTRFTYSNTNYVLLALIIERVSGMSFRDYMQKDIFGPLGMKDTWVFGLEDTLTAVPSFDHYGGLWKNDFLEATYGDKNIYSTARDLLKWDQALYSGTLLSPALLDSAFKGYSFERPGINNYGLGWRLQLLPNNKKVIYHFGRWHGFNAAFARLTDEKTTIIILGNKYTRNVYNAAAKSYNLFGDYSKDAYQEDESEGSGSPGQKRKSSTSKRSGK